MKRAFLTGATGLVGYELARQLVERGVTVLGLTRSGSFPGDLARRGVEPVRGDLGDARRLAAMMKDADVVFHVAADVNMWRVRWAENVRTNVEGTHNMVRAALRAGVAKFVHCSSLSTIGKPRTTDESAPPPVVDETHAYDLHDLGMVYPHTKWLSERAVEDAIDDGLDAVITHPAMIFGPGDWKRNLLPFFRAAERGGIPVAPGGWRTTCDVRDVALGHIQAAEKGRSGERYILGGESMPARDMLARIARAMGARPPLVTLPDPIMIGLGRVLDAFGDLTRRPPTLTWEMAMQSTFRVQASSAKAERELGYHARPFEESLRDSIAWYREQGMLS